MPRDLEPIAKEDSIQGFPHLSRETQIDLDKPSPLSMDPEQEEEAMISALAQRNDKRDQLHPYTQSLTLADVDSCVR